jgi:hypothetical protein
MLIGLPVDGKAVTGVSEWYYNDLCPDYLGKTPIKPGSKAKKIIISWLRDNFTDLTAESSTRRKQQYCRAYILLLIGSVLMPDTSGSSVHLKYLVPLKDFSKIGEYSWGSA